MSTPSLAQVASSLIAKLPEVTGMVVSDRAGVLLQSTGELPEDAGAVYAVTVETLSRAGDDLGLGPLLRIAIAAPQRGCIVAAHEEGVVGVIVDPTKPLGGVEKKIESILRR